MDRRYVAIIESVRREMTHEDRAHLGERARRFLQSLDPESQVGMWFDAFAASFPSRLGAAVAYVRDSPLLTRAPRAPDPPRGEGPGALNARDDRAPRQDPHARTRSPSARSECE